MASASATATAMPNMSPEQVLDTAYNEVADADISGSCTAVLAMLIGETLHTANLGDSAVVVSGVDILLATVCSFQCVLMCCKVYRDGRMIYRSEEQCHDFNTPFQVGTGSRDTAAQADLWSADALDGDSK